MEKSKYNFKKPNLVCECGRGIFGDDVYYIEMNTDKKPILLCEFCVSRK